MFQKNVIAMCAYLLAMPLFGQRPVKLVSGQWIDVCVMSPDTNGRAYGINAGVIAGESGDPTAFKDVSGTKTALGTGSAAYGLNASADIVGFFNVSNSKGTFKRAFLYHSGTLASLGTISGGLDPGGTDTTTSEAHAVDSGSAVVGCSELTHGNSPGHAFKKTLGGTMVDLGTNGEPNSCAYGINDTGDVAVFGNYPVGKLFKWNGSYTDTGITGVRHVGGINSSGVIVGARVAAGTGSCIDSTGPCAQAFYYDSSVHFIPLLSGNSANGATGINDSGQIVGYATTPGPQHPFLYTIGGHLQIWG